MDSKIPVADPWRDAVIDRCAVACLDGDFADPRATLGRLIAWHVRMALDPLISEAAAALVLAAKVEALEWAATVCDKLDSPCYEPRYTQGARDCMSAIRAGKGYT